MPRLERCVWSNDGRISRRVAKRGCLLSDHERTSLAHTVESFDGRYFGVRGNSGLFHRVSPGRMFRSKEEATASLRESALEGKKERER